MGGDPQTYLALASLASSMARNRSNPGAIGSSGGMPVQMGRGSGPIFNAGNKPGVAPSSAPGSGTIPGVGNPAHSYALEELINKLILAKMSGSGTPPFSISGGSPQQLNPLQMLAGAGGSGNYGSMSSLFG